MSHCVGEPVGLVPLRDGTHLDRDQFIKLHQRGYSDAQIARWFENERNVILTRRQIFYWRNRWKLPANSQRPRFDGNGLKTRREQNEMVRRLAVTKLGWGHLLPSPVDPEGPPDDATEATECPLVSATPVATPRDLLAPDEWHALHAPAVTAPPIVFDLKPTEAVILSLLEEHRYLTRRQLVALLGKHRSRNPLRSGGVSYLRRLARAGLIVEHPAVWNKKPTKAYSLAENLPRRTRTRRDDGIEMMIKSMYANKLR